MADPEIVNDKKITPPKRRWIKLTALGLVILLSGAVIGGGLTFTFLWKRAIAQYQNRNTTQAADRMAARISRRLDLDANQKEQLRAIVNKHLANLAVLRKEIRPQAAMEVRAMQLEIEEMLTGRQKEKWKRDANKFNHRWMERRN